MHAFHAGRVHEDFKEGFRQGQALYFGCIKLESNNAAWTAIRTQLVEVAANSRLEQVMEQTQNTVFIQALHAGKLRVDLV